jgi:transcription elongation factor GreA
MTQKLAIKNPKIYLTPEGLADVKNELKFLKEEKRIAIAERLKQARELGEIEENSEYDSALAEQELVETKIFELEAVVRDAKLIKQEDKDTSIVTIGSTVSVEMDGSLDEFTIVGRVEANPSQKKISNESPVGIALLGAKVGEEVEVTTPIVKYKCKILEIK